jgi:Beta-lactamase
MHCFSPGGALSGLVLAQNEGAHHHAYRQPTEQAVNVLISLRSGLLIELLINASSCHVGGARTSTVTTEVRSKRVDPVDEGEVAGLHGLLQACLMDERTIGDDRSSDRDEDAAAYVANKVDYSGEGYIYLQRVVEQITGKPLNTFMTETVFEPPGMSRSSYVWRPDFDALTATGYDAGGKPTPVEKPKKAGAASTLNTTAKDYALFVDAVLNRKGLKPRTLREMETPQIALDPECRICIKRQPTQSSKNLFWGLGWGIQRTD